MKKIFLVDVSSLFFRAFHAIQRLNNAQGMPTNALYGFLAAIMKVLKDHQPYGVVFCFDSPGAGFREEIYPEYKANRESPPDEIVVQFPYLKKVAEALNVPAFEMSRFEADDIIGTLAVRLKSDETQIVIVSGDKDFGQCVNDHVVIFDPAKDITLDATGVRGKFGVGPELVIDYLALVGDSSDNVPGVRGIGPKGALKLLEEFGNLDELYRRVDEVKNERVRGLLKDQKEMALLSRQLVTIRTDLDIHLAPEDIKLKPVRRDLLAPLMEELGFKTLATRFLGTGGVTPATADPVTGPDAAIQGSTFLGNAVPTTPRVSGDLFSASAGVGISGRSKKSINQVAEIHKHLDLKSGILWIDSEHQGIALSDGQTVIRYEGALDALIGFLSEFGSGGGKWAGFDIKRMAHDLKLKSGAIQKIQSDVLLEAYCLDSSDDLELGKLVEKYLGSRMPEFALPEDRLDLIVSLHEALQPKLASFELSSVLSRFDFPLIPILFKMETWGVSIDSVKLGEYSRELGSESQVLEKKINDLAGYPFNVGSPKQLGQVLFEKLKLPATKKTKTGYSTDSDVLEELKSKHPICELVLDWREITKLRSTYIDVLPRLAQMAPDGRVHTQYNQAVTSTGRLSSVHPNLQNIPIRTKRGNRIRESFTATPGFQLLSADYSQVELRILAHITDDAGLKRAFANDWDIHAATASEVFGVKLDEVNAEQRRAAKAINFGIVYGMSDFGLSASLGIERKEASEFITRYFAKYPGVQAYMRSTIEEGARRGYVETIFGRRRYYPGLKSSNGRLRQNAERAAINMPIQGSAADIMKLAMIELDHKFQNQGDRVRMIMQVHDELVFEVKAGDEKAVGDVVRSTMESAGALSIPLKVSLGVGSTWAEAH